MHYDNKYRRDSYRSSREAFGKSYRTMRERRWNRKRGLDIDLFRNLYIQGKAAATRFFVYALFFLSVVMTAYAGIQQHTIQKLRYDIEEGNSVQCDPGYLSKIVDGARVTCVMQKASPSMATYRKVMMVRR